MRMIPLPLHILTVCDTLEKAGFAAYVVGGGVRDALLGRTPSDFDVATSALPNEVIGLFPHTVPTGIKHGTVTVFFGDSAVEVTTFRKDGAYAECRRPENVQFLSNIEEDLYRRDFTINAMAYHPKKGILDICGGQKDLENRVIRTVGDAKTRFSEDALRILRCFRFAAQLDFTIDMDTLHAAEELAYMLKNVSHERIFAELTKTFAVAKLHHYKGMKKVLGVILPQALPFDDVKCEKAAACQYAEAKWATLCAENTGEALEVLKAPRKLRLAATELSLYKTGRSPILDIAALRYNTAETLADYTQNEEIKMAYQNAKEEGKPLSLAELAIDGETLLAMGFKGIEIGQILQTLFMYVTENLVNNKEDSLKEACKTLCKNETLPRA